MPTKRNISSAMKQIYGTGNFNPQRLDRNPRGAKRLYLWGIGILVLAIAAAIAFGLFVFSKTPNSFTGDRVSLSLITPTEILTAIPQEYTVEIQNNEEVALEDVELFIDWSSAQVENGPSIAFIDAKQEAISEANNTWKLGEIASGDTTLFTFTARLSGREDQQLTLPISLTFQPVTFSSEFVVREDVPISLGAGAVSLAFDGPETVADGAEIALELTIGGQRNSVNPEKYEVVIEYPESFSIISEDPTREEDDVYIWNMSDIPLEGDVRNVHIRGTIDGVLGTNQEFYAEIRDVGNTNAITKATHTVNVQSADFAVGIKAQPASGQKLQWGEKVSYTVTIQNTGTYVMRDSLVSVRLSGDSLWKTDSLEINQNGIFEGGAIIWDTQSTNSLDSIRPDNDLTLTFSFETKNNPPNGFTGTPALLAKAQVRTSLGDQEVTVESGEEVTNILAEVSYDSFGWYQSPEGITYGSGPHPPLPGQETTYAMVWRVGPASAPLEDLKLTAVLPDGITWKNDTNLSVGEITYNQSNRTVTWEAVRVPKLDLPIDIRFKVSITPNNIPPSSTRLTERSTLSAVDAPTGESMELYNNPIIIGGIE